jgi:hypothetical protein
MQARKVHSKNKARGGAFKSTLCLLLALLLTTNLLTAFVAPPSAFAEEIPQTTEDTATPDDAAAVLDEGITDADADTDADTEANAAPDADAPSPEGELSAIENLLAQISDLTLHLQTTAAFVPVTEITLSNTELAVYTQINLSTLATVAPTDATNQIITWALKEGGINTCGARFTGAAPNLNFYAMQGGIAEVTATIVDGTAEGVSYTKDFTIYSVAPASITAGAFTYDPSNKAHLIQKAEVTLNITAPSNKAVYGFRTAIKYPGGDYISLDTAALIADNANLGAGANRQLLINEQLGAGLAHSQSSIRTTPSYDYIGVESDGTVLIPAGGTLSIKLAFIYQSYNSASPIGAQAISVGDGFNVAGSDLLTVLFIDSSVKQVDLLAGEDKTARQIIDGLRDQPVTGNAANGQNAKIVALQVLSSSMTTVAPTAASIVPGVATAYDGEGNVLSPADVTKIKQAVWTVTLRAPENMDIYGFRTTLRYPNTDYFKLNLEKLKSENTSVGAQGRPLLIDEELGTGVSGGTVTQSNVEYLYHYIGIDSDGVNPLIKAGESITIKLVCDFGDYQHYTTATGTRQIFIGENVGLVEGDPAQTIDRVSVLFTDKGVHLSDLLADESQTSRQKIDALRDQEVSTNATSGPNAKAIMLGGPYTGNISTTAPVPASPASITVTHPNYGTDESLWVSGTITRDIGEYIDLKITLKAPGNAPVYGLVVTPNIAALYYEVDNEVLANLNSGISGLSIVSCNEGSSLRPSYQIESDGLTPVIAAGGTLTLNLRVKAVMTDPGSRAIGIASFGLLSTVFLLDPAIRIPDILPAGLSGYDLTGLTGATDRQRIWANASVSQAVTTTASMPRPLINGEYWLRTAEDVIWFSNQVNSGNNTINANLRNNITEGLTSADGFKPIGTKEHPFLGTFITPWRSSGGSFYADPMYVTIDLTAENNDGTGFFGVVGDGQTEGVLIAGVGVKGVIHGGDYSNIGGLAGIVNKVDGIGTLKITYNNNPVTIGYRPIPMNSAQITSSGNNIGGVFGSASDITNYSAIKNTGVVSGGENVGGIAGILSGDFVSSGYNGNAWLQNSGDISGLANVGGVAGYSSGGNMSYRAPNESNLASYFAEYVANSGNISASSATGAAGGVVGKMEGTDIANAVNVGKVSGGIAGGIVGLTFGTDGQIIYSWNNGVPNDNSHTGAVQSIGLSQSGAAGGIVGKNEAEELVLSGCTNLSPIVAENGGVTGGIVGAGNVLADSGGGNYYVDSTATSDAVNSPGVPRSRLVSQVVSNTYGNTYVYIPPEPTNLIGDGSPENPYQFSEALELVWLASKVNSNQEPATDNKICVLLTADIDLRPVAFEFQGIGRSNGGNSVSYGGIFDGGGHTVTVNSQNGGLFNTCVDATIKNIVVEGTVKGNAAIANFVRNTVIENCVNNADITVSAGAGGGIVGGIGASVVIYTGDAFIYENPSIIRNCTNNGSISGLSDCVGGIVGEIANESTVEDCNNTGDITGPYLVGGIAGRTYGGGSILRCTNSGTVTSTARTSAGGGGGAGTIPPTLNTAGGILGANMGSKTTIVDSCENDGYVGGTANNLGGIVGSANYNSGNFESPVLVVTNCINRGTVESTYDDPDAEQSIYGKVKDKINVGGIVGNLSNAQTGSDISDNTNSGTIIGGLAPSGQVGSITGTGGDRFVGSNSSTVLTEKDMGDSRIVWTGSGDDPRIVPITPTTPTTPTTPGTPYIPGDLTPAGSTDTDTPSAPSSGPTANTPSSSTAPRTSTPSTTTAPQPDVAPDPDTPLVGTEVVSTRPAQTFIEYVIDNPLLIPVGILALALIVGGAAFAYVRFKRNTEDSTTKHGS